MKNFIKNIKEIKEKPHGKSILFFGFYLIFFLVIICVARLGGRNSTKVTDYEKGNPLTFHIGAVLQNNYSFDYQIYVDDQVYSYQGKRKDKESSFSFQGKEYYCNEDHYFVKEETWIKSDNPYLYPSFLDIEKFSSLIQASTYVSKTSYESGKMTYNMLLSTNTINAMIHQVNSDFMEEPNQIIISTDENKNVNEIKFILDSYCTLNQYCQKTLKITIHYDDFGSIKEIENPIA